MNGRMGQYTHDPDTQIKYSPADFTSCMQRDTFWLHHERTPPLYPLSPSFHPARAIRTRTQRVQAIVGAPHWQRRRMMVLSVLLVPKNRDSSVRGQ